MAVIVRLPRVLHARAGPEIRIDEPVHDIEAVRTVLQRDHPDVARELSGTAFAIAVNGVRLLPGVRQYPVKDGDFIDVDSADGE